MNMIKLAILIIWALIFACDGLGWLANVDKEKP